MIETRELERLASCVRGATQEGGLIDTAQVKLVGLDDVREAAGARWPRMREYVRERSLKIIAQRIGPEDAVLCCGDGFLVVFANAGAEGAQARCADIREALIAFYLGEETLAALRAEVDQQSVAASSLSGLMTETAPMRHVAQQRNKLQLGRFWPVWSGRHLGIAAFSCRPGIETAAGWRMAYSPDYIATGAHRSADYLDLDLCLLEQACASAEHEGAAVIGVSVHATTMQSRKARTTYLEHLAANASPVLQRMFVTIAEIEPGAPLLSLTDWSAALKHYFPRVCLELHYTDRALRALASTGAWAAGFHLPTAPIASAGQARAVLNHLDAWCSVLVRQGVIPFVSGFQESAFFDLASVSDIGFATGEALWPSQTAPTKLALTMAQPRAQMARAPQNPALRLEPPPC